MKLIIAKAKKIDVIFVLRNAFFTITSCKNKMSINRISKPLDGAEVKLNKLSIRSSENSSKYASRYSTDLICVLKKSKLK